MSVVPEDTESPLKEFCLYGTGVALLVYLAKLAKGRTLDLSSMSITGAPVALGALVGTYRASSILMRQASNSFISRLSAHDRRTLSGIWASSVAVTLLPELNSQVLTAWLLVKAARSAPQVFPSDFNSGLASMLVAMITTGQILSSYMWCLTDLSPGYVNFLASCGGQPKDKIASLRLSTNADMLRPFCGTLHPGKSCSGFAWQVFGEGALTGFKVHSVLHVVSFVLSGGQRGLLSTLRSLARATLFLGAYPASAFLLICSWWKVSGWRGARRPFLVFLGSFIGLTLYIESPSRRPEISGYLTAQALVALWRQGVRKHWWSTSEWIGHALWVFSFALLARWSASRGKSGEHQAEQRKTFFEKIFARQH